MTYSTLRRTSSYRRECEDDVNGRTIWKGEGWAEEQYVEGPFSFSALCGRLLVRLLFRCVWPALWYMRCVLAIRILFLFYPGNFFVLVLFPFFFSLLFIAGFAF
jgi:hypothetical protein